MAECAQPKAICNRLRVHLLLSTCCSQISEICVTEKRFSSLYNRPNKENNRGAVMCFVEDSGQASLVRRVCTKWRCVAQVCVGLERTMSCSVTGINKTYVAAQQQGLTGSVIDGCDSMLWLSKSVPSVPFLKRETERGKLKAIHYFPGLKSKCQTHQGCAFLFRLKEL